MKHTNSTVHDTNEIKAISNTVFDELVNVLIKLNRQPKHLNLLRAFLINNRCHHIAKLTDNLVDVIDYYYNDLDSASVSAWVYKVYKDELDYTRAKSYANAHSRTLPAFAYTSYHTSNYYNIHCQYCVKCGCVLNSKNECPNAYLHLLDGVDFNNVCTKA